MSFRSYYCCDQRYLGHPCTCPKPTEYWDALRRMHEDDLRPNAEAAEGWTDPAATEADLDNEKEKPDAP